MGNIKKLTVLYKTYF